LIRSPVIAHFFFPTFETFLYLFKYNADFREKERERERKREKERERMIYRNTGFVEM